jgi:CheY-like chemotaxis protein
LANELASDLSIGAAAAIRAGALALVVDDEPLVRRLTLEMLADAGFGVLEAGGAAQAMQLLESHEGIALIVSDINMPGQDGVSFAAAARALRPGVAVLLVSGNPRPGGVHCFVAKPFTCASLLRAVDTALARAASGF